MAANPPGQAPAAYGGAGAPQGGAATTAAAGAGIVGVIGALALVAIAIALFMLQGSADTQACVRKAEAQFPTVPVSAFVTGGRSATGPLKVSFYAERQKAVQKC